MLLLFLLLVAELWSATKILQKVPKKKQKKQRINRAKVLVLAKKWQLTQRSWSSWESAEN